MNPTSLNISRLKTFPSQSSNKKSKLLILSLLLCQWALSQSAISGKITSQTEDPLAFTNVLLLLQEDSSLVKGAVSDENGLYQFNQISSDNYLISVSMIGFETVYAQSFHFDGIVDLQIAPLTLKENEALMEEVVVAALRPLYEQKMDRIVINVNNSITSAGGNALEVLSRSPGVDVNEIGEVISINGKSGVQVLINGKISRLPMNTILDILRGIDASNIEKIELYDTPPAHLDAEGNGGVINILLKKNKELGTNGSYSAKIGFGRKLKYSASVNLNHRTEKYNLYGSYSLSHRFTKQTYLFDRKVNQMGDLVTTDSENDRDGESLRNSVSIGLDYNLSKKTILGVLASGYFTNFENTSNNISTYLTSNNPFSIIENLNEESSEKRYGMFNVNLQHKFQTAESISFDVDYLHFNNDNPSTYFNDFYDGENNLLSKSEVLLNSKTPINNISTKVDYNKSLNDQLSFQIGLKGAGSQFGNTVIANEIIGGNEIKLEQFSQDYELEERIGAAYGSVDYSINAKTKMSIGLRYEYTDYLLATPDNPKFLDQQYGNFFPSFFFSRKTNELDQFQLSYSRRISRPAFNELAPFVTFIDPSTFFIGNPKLQPGFSNNLKTSYKVKTVLLTLQYSYSTDIIATYQPVLDPETNTQFYTTLNLDEEHSAGLSILIPFNPTDWWNIQSKTSGSLERVIVQEKDSDIHLDSKRLIFDLVNTVKLPNQLTLEVAGQYKTAAYYGLLEVQPRGYLNLGLQKRFRNGMLRLNCSDVFRTNIWKSKTNVPELDLENTLTVDVETRVIRLSYSANFGKKTVKGKRRRSTSSQEEQRRIR
ncbi:MAG: outer membrane receptor protein involved in Fe transport [Flavobacteriales bacterium]|jgi:outer membrane receptor protein involved in Fe transport